VDPEVFQLYLRGRYHANQFSPEEVRKGIRYFEQAIAKDSAYAAAHAGLALAWSSLSSVVSAPHEVMPKALAEARKALELDESLSEAHTALANVKMFYEWDWDGAEKKIQRAIELNSSSADAHRLYGEFFGALGRAEEAVQEIERSSALDPMSLLTRRDLLASYVAARQYDRAIEEGRRVVERTPNFAAAYAFMGMAYAQKKQFAEAIQSIEKARSLNPGYTMDHFLAIAHAQSGNKAEAKKLLERIEEVARNQYVCAYEVASVHVALGDNDTAHKWMQRGVSEQCDCMVWLKREPWMDPLRVDPRYKDLMDRVFKGR
jgi:serine/threonine-protein kinase